MRLEKIQKLLLELQAKRHAVLDEDESLTESEVALGRLVLPLYNEREALNQRVADLSRRAEAHQVAVNHLPVAALVIDAAGVLLLVNRAAQELFRGPAIPAPVLEEAKRFVLRPIHRERSATFTRDGKSVTLRLILGQLREAEGPRKPEIVFAVPSGAPIPLEKSRLVDRFGYTPKEAEVVGLVAQGLTNKEIAKEMGVSPETVRTHMTEAFGKSGAKNRAELVTLAVAAVFGIGPEP